MATIFTKPTITEGQFLRIASRLFRRWSDMEAFMGNLRHELSELGVKIIPNPEPTNAEKLRNMIRSAQLTGMDAENIADYLDRYGIRVKDN